MFPASCCLGASEGLNKSPYVVLVSLSEQIKTFRVCREWLSVSVCAEAVRWHLRMAAQAQVQVLAAPRVGEVYVGPGSDLISMHTGFFRNAWSLNSHGFQY